MLPRLMSNQRRGLSLLEGTIVLVVVVIAAALLIPAVRIAIDSSRKARCSMNLSRVGKAMEEHITQYQSYPSGCKRQSDGSYGASWWFELLPYVEDANQAVYSKWTKGPSHGNFNSDAENKNIVLADGLALPVMLCPSSPLPKFNNPEDHIADFNRKLLAGPAQGIVLPMYAAVSGSAPDMLAVPVGSQPVAPAGRNTQDGPLGVLSASGVFPPNVTIRPPNIKGPTMLVVEQSDWGRLEVAGQQLTFDMRSSYPAGAFNGTDGNYGTLSPKAEGINGTGEARCFNVTTIRHPVNTKSYEAGVVSFLPPPPPPEPKSGEPPQPVQMPPGSEAHGPGHNHGIFSAHPGGANVLHADLSVKFLSDDTDVRVLLMLSTRDDDWIPDSPN